MTFTSDMYYLVKDSLTDNEKAIAFFHNGDKVTFMGFFDKHGEFHHTGQCGFDVADCRAVVEVSDAIVAGEFEDLYNTAKDEEEGEE